MGRVWLSKVNLLMGRVALSPWYLFGLGQPSPGAYGLDGKVKGKPQEGL